MRGLAGAARAERRALPSWVCHATVGSWASQVEDEDEDENEDE